MELAQDLLLFANGSKRFLPDEVQDGRAERLQATILIELGPLFSYCLQLLFCEILISYFTDKFVVIFRKLSKSAIQNFFSASNESLMVEVEMSDCFFGSVPFVWIVSGEDLTISRENKVGCAVCLERRNHGRIVPITFSSIAMFTRCISVPAQA